MLDHGDNELCTDLNSPAQVQQVDILSDTIMALRGLRRRMTCWQLFAVASMLFVVALGRG